MRLKDQITIITGGGRGIGKALALAFAREGSHVVLVARTESEIQATAAEVQRWGRKALPLKVDVSREEEVQEMVQKSLETFGRIDTLINNAGVLTPRVPLVEVSTQDWNLTFDVNLKGTFLCCREVLPIMMKQRTGNIINLSSGVVHRVATHWGPYAISKVAVEYLTKVLAEEVRAYGIRVNAVNPGKAATRMRAMAYPEEDPSTLPKPEDITEVFVYLASSEAKEVTGQLWMPDNGNPDIGLKFRKASKGNLFNSLLPYTLSPSRYCLIGKGATWTGLSLTPMTAPVSPRFPYGIDSIP